MVIFHSYVNLPEGNVYTLINNTISLYIENYDEYRSGSNEHKNPLRIHEWFDMKVIVNSG